MIQRKTALQIAMDAFAHWRKNRSKLTRIPDELILLAARAAEEDAVTRVALDLKLKRSNLTKRIALLGSDSLCPEEVVNGAPVDSTSYGSLHFSRLNDSFIDAEISSARIKSLENSQIIHSQVILKNGITVSFYSLDGTRILCDFMTKQGEDL